MEKTVKHPGTVIAAENGLVKVTMQVTSACASCEAHAKCGFAESKEKIVEIATPDWQDYHVDDPVTVIIKTGNGLLAVLIAYILPAVLLLATFITLYCLRLPEVWSAILTLCVVGLYGLVLCLFRGRLQRKFTFTLRKD